MNVDAFLDDVFKEVVDNHINDMIYETDSLINQLKGRKELRTEYKSLIAISDFLSKQNKHLTKPD